MILNCIKTLIQIKYKSSLFTYKLNSKKRTLEVLVQGILHEREWLKEYVEGTLAHTIIFVKLFLLTLKLEI